jgi:UDP-3-O-[3-hydroxymyristoyl] N-acetylglucosamine deacetylase/3-hydroxyacyl-[acyl-carrier-protein] dehydratase
MKSKQRTIKAPVSISGVGLHTGCRVNLTFNPAPENHGYKFKRVDVERQPIIEADVDLVKSTDRGTTLSKNGVEVGTVEHVLAACAGLSIDNLLIELDAPEAPIMDGSAAPFVKALLDAGIEEQTADREYFEISDNIYYKNDDQMIEMMALPLDGYRMTVMIEFDSPVLGSQHASILEMEEFTKNISSARTFCLLTELEALHNKNLIKGGDVNNAIVVVDKVIPDNDLENLATLFNKEKDELKIDKGGFLNNQELRFLNEPARHKLLDMIGDLALVGVPLKAQIMAARPGHAANIEFAKRIKNAIKEQQKTKKKSVPKYNPNSEPVYSLTQIANFIPHRYPFLLIDKVIKIDDKQVVGIKNVTFNEHFFVGHFPGDPIMPGVLQIEALAQLGGVFVLHKKPDPEKYSTLFLKIDKTRFKEMVRPGDTLILRSELLSPIRRGVCIMKAEGFVGDKLVVEAELTAQVVKKEE